MSLVPRPLEGRALFSGHDRNPLDRRGAARGPADIASREVSVQAGANQVPPARLDDRRRTDGDWMLNRMVNMGPGSFGAVLRSGLCRFDTGWWARARVQGPGIATEVGGLSAGVCADHAGAAGRTGRSRLHEPGHGRELVAPVPQPVDDARESSVVRGLGTDVQQEDRARDGALEASLHHLVGG